MKYITPLLLFIISFSSFSQTNLDSLWRKWENDLNEDTVRFNALFNFVKKGYLKNKPDSALYFLKLGEEFTKIKNLEFENTKIITAKASIYMTKGKFNEALVLYNKALVIFKAYKNEKEVQNINNNIGFCYFYKADYKNAIIYLTKAMKYSDKVNDKEFQAKSYINVGAVYKETKEYEKALNYYLQGLDLYQDIGSEKGISTTLSNIATIYSAKEDYIKSMEFNKKSLNRKLAVGDQYLIAVSYFNIAINYLSLDTIPEYIEKIGEEKQLIANDSRETIRSINQQEALDYYEKALAIGREINNDFLISLTHLGLGDLYYQKKEYKKAIKYSTIGLKGLKNIGSKPYEIEALNLLYLIYKDKGNSNAALDMYEHYIELRDSIDNEENTKEILEQEYKYSYEKKKSLDSLSNAESQKIKEIQIDKQQIEINNKKIQQYYLFGGLGLAILALLYIFKQNREVKEKNREVEEQKQLLENQKDALAHKNIEIKDSIQYAQRLQSSVLPSKKDVSLNFSNNFILFKPKDVVSGDFYWTYQKNELRYLAVIDCTGHGVPGAFMTIVANNLLNEIIQGDFNTPKEILTELHYRIKLRLGGNKNAQIRDSMDLGLFSYNSKNNTINFSGTHTSIYRVRNSKLEKYKGSKADIGYKDNIIIEEQIFTVEPNDMLYMHSDGYPDQKGGPKGKKYYYQPIRNKMEEISLLNLAEQELIMAKNFDDWKGDTVQLDDVCMIGVRI